MNPTADSFEERKKRYYSMPFQPSEMCGSCRYASSEDKSPCTLQEDVHCELHEREEEFLKGLPEQIREELESLRRTSRCIFYEYYVRHMGPERVRYR